MPRLPKSRVKQLSEYPIHHGDPSRLADLLGRASDDAPRWLGDDLADIIAHQLRAPLLFDLDRVRPETPTADPLGRPGGPEIHTLGELFAHTRPPLELLMLTKNFAKTCDLTPDFALPSEIASALYFAAIAAALVRLDERITALDDRGIADGINWALSQSWIDSTLRSLFELAVDRLHVDDGSGT